MISYKSVSGGFGSLLMRGWASISGLKSSVIHPQHRVNDCYLLHVF